MSRWRSSTFIFIALALAACGQATPTPGPTVGEAKDFNSVCDKANNGKRVAVVGYLQFPASFTVSDSVVLRLFAGNDFAGSAVGVQINFGTQANQVQTVTDQYTDADLRVYLANGQVAPYRTKVKVSGQVYFPLTSQDFACGLENPLVELAP
jgi:hypothetical protein